MGYGPYVVLPGYGSLTSKLATWESIAYLPMMACFVTFFFNDLYGFYNWRRMQQRQINAVAAGRVLTLPD